jgi:Thioredoxin-related protein
MYKITLMFAMLLINMASFAQGVNFQKCTYKEALEKAAKENKNLFLEFSTTWCGPCKMMAKTIFPNPKVGEVINNSFISLALDAEKGEGIELSKKYGVKGYPTMIFLDKEGKELNRLVGATPNADFFITLVQQVLGEKPPYSELRKRYDNGERDLDFVRQLISDGGVYANTLQDETERKALFQFNKNLVNWYFTQKKPSELMNPEDFGLITTYLDGANNGNPIVENIYDNYSEWKKHVPVDDLIMYIQRTNNQSIHQSYKNGNLDYKKYLEQIKTRLAPVYADVKKEGIENPGEDTYKVMTFVAEAGYALAKIKM